MNVALVVWQLLFTTLVVRKNPSIAKDCNFRLGATFPSGCKHFFGLKHWVICSMVEIVAGCDKEHSHREVGDFFAVAEFARLYGEEQ